MPANVPKRASARGGLKAATRGGVKAAARGGTKAVARGGVRGRGRGGSNGVAKRKAGPRAKAGPKNGAQRGRNDGVNDGLELGAIVGKGGRRTAVIGRVNDRNGQSPGGEDCSTKSVAQHVDSPVIDTEEQGHGSVAEKNAGEMQSSAQQANSMLDRPSKQPILIGEVAASSSSRQEGSETGVDEFLIKERATEWKSLLFYLRSKAAHPLMLCGCSGSGKTHLIRNMMNFLGTDFCIVSASEAVMCRSIWESAADQLTGHNPSPSNGFCSGGRVQGITELLARVLAKKSADYRCFMVIDDAQRLQQIDKTLIQTLVTIPRISHGRVRVIFVGRVDHTALFVQPYNRQQLCSILCRCITSRHSSHADATTKTLLPQFVAMIVDSLVPLSRDVSHFISVGCSLFPKYAAPVRAGTIRPVEKERLYAMCKPYLQDVARCAGVTTVLEDSSANNEAFGQGKRSSGDGLALGLCARVLLCAAFLCSQNPPRTDRAYFGHTRNNSSLRRVRRRRPRVTQVDKDRALAGPRVFELERLLAIYESLRTQLVEPAAVPPGGDVMDQVAALVSADIVVPMSFDGPLSGRRFRCNISREVADTVGSSCRLQLQDLLHG